MSIKKNSSSLGGKAAALKATPYDEKNRCPLKEAVKFLAGAWTLEVYWYLRQSPLRFGELKRNLEFVSPKVLTQRLRDLEELGIVHRQVLETSPPQVEYSLTDLGKKFLPAIDLIAEVGQGLLRKSSKK